MKKIINIFLVFSLVLSYPTKASGPSHLIDSYGSYVAAVLGGSLDSVGLSVRSFMDPNLPGWKQVEKDIDFDLSLENCLSIDCGDEGPYDRDLAFISSGYLGKADRVQLLPNTESFDLRKKLIEEAKESIYMMVWSIYDDETGFEFMKQLFSALDRNPDLDIKIIVDGNVATLGGHRKFLKDMEELSDGRIKILKWKTHKYRANGTHRKMIIFDKKTIITGGMNVGNSYAHFQGAPQWRDLDMLIEGESAGISAYNQFVTIWNSHDSKKPSEQIAKLKPIEVDEDQTQGIPLVFIDQHPGSTHKKAHMGVHTAVVKLLRNAKDTIDIENAYFIMDPVLKTEIKAAIDRGVKVRIFTNSKESIDMAVVTNPILKSAKKASNWGADVYIKRGATLHAKYMIVDGVVSMVGSFNFHPRSLRFDGENAVVVIDEEFARGLTEHFEEGINHHAYKVDSPSMLKVVWNLGAAMAEEFYFDFL
jgi:cardiolipin synthase A/B